MTDDAPLDHTLCDEAHLIRSTLAGEPAAFGQLVLKHQDRLYNTLVRLLGSAEDARDICQDAFVQAFLKLESFRGTAKFYTWLYRIAFNLAMSHRRRERPTASLDASRMEHGLEPADGQPLPDASAACGDRARLVHAALAEMTIDLRQVIVLRELDGCRYEEIAEILEVPIGTVRSRLFRARLALRDRLAPILGEETTDSPAPHGKTLSAKSRTTSET